LFYSSHVIPTITPAPIPAPATPSERTDAPFAAAVDVAFAGAAEVAEVVKTVRVAMVLDVLSVVLAETVLVLGFPASVSVTVPVDFELSFVSVWVEVAAGHTGVLPIMRVASGI
jgi:hypothetical protein